MAIRRPASRTVRIALTSAAAAVAAVGVAVVTAAALAGGVPGQGSDDIGRAAGNGSGDGLIVGEAADHLPSITASDWVTYADHVIAVTATAEHALAPTEAELARGEGTIGRTVTLRVDEVLWSRDGAPQPAPETWEYSASGWQFTGGDSTNRTRLAMHDRPRVEIGHRYVMAVVWEEARCSPGDPPVPAQWRGLGEGSELPYEDGTIGQGEQEGRPQTATDARLAAEDSQAAGLEEQLAGRNAAALVSALNAAAPQVDPEFAPGTQAESTCP